MTIGKKVKSVFKDNFLEARSVTPLTQGMVLSEFWEKKMGSLKTNLLSWRASLNPRSLALRTIESIWELIELKCWQLP